MVKRGEIRWVDLADPIGSAPGYRRPAVVVSSDRFNRSRIATVVVAAITSNTRLAEAPGNVSLPDDLLPRPSVVNVSQLLTVDRRQLAEVIAVTPPSALTRLDEGLRLVLALGQGT